MGDFPGDICRRDEGGKTLGKAAEEGWAEIRTFGFSSTGYKRPGPCVEFCQERETLWRTLLL